jgi:hypothetical protein
MRRVVHRAIGAALAAAATAAIVWASNAPVTVNGSDQALLRLTWSVRPERVEICRQQSPEELARLPQHMRQPVICEGRSATYRLKVRQGDRMAVDRTVHGGGLRQDRRLYVFQDVPLAPGDVPIEVTLDRIDPVGAASVPTPAPPATGASSARQPPAADAVPAHLSFAERLHVSPRQVILITYSPERRALIAVDEATGR